MYSTYDFLKGETSQNNDGIIGMIDLFRIVPSDIPILKRAGDLGNWVDVNLSPSYNSLPDYCYRYLSTNEINKIPTQK